MAIYTSDTEVKVVENGFEVPLTRERLAADVIAQAGGTAALTGPPGPSGADGAPGARGETGAAGAPGQGVATGGTSGRLLAKTGSADYATGWIDPPIDGKAVGYASSTATVRPAGYALVVWIGLDAPSNTVSANGDLWIKS
ncbi:collagen-like protein [Conexibacter sp. CPCC 206217]|uniref:collagen-like triple helix repeat-containing protein n=1 Tax=Conexibacter sp. CPCC 206217 TaxID=3064574 RepID=UPI002722E423|nr:collagen-like protein [Conexibacter sp. CPCC 206217]MDO8209288.1 collagen-like protein [Conexibacter sp. CPCC 206217]